MPIRILTASDVEQALTMPLAIAAMRAAFTQLTAGRDTIPAIVRGTDDTALLRDALLENLHRANLNPIEEANAYAQLLQDFVCTLGGRLSSRRVLDTWGRDRWIRCERSSLVQSKSWRSWA